MIYDGVKRLMDIVGSIVGIILLSPLLLAIAILIKLDSPGPILADVPLRVGKDGKLFNMYKFRSMVSGAHELLHTNPEYKKLLEQYRQNSFKLENDPRVTKLGRILRKTSFDEFHQ